MILSFTLASYIVVCEQFYNASELNEKSAQYVEQGYEPQGGVMMARNQICQAFFKK